MPLHIIGAGLCRTGTSSLKAAIEQLDLGPCYHMKENFLNQDSQKWVDIHDAVRAGKSLDELKEMFEAVWQREEKTYKAAVDYPSQVYYKQLADIYPDAKVVRTLSCTLLCKSMSTSDVSVAKSLSQCFVASTPGSYVCSPGLLTLPNH
jgi:Sulfotransferase domain